MKNKGLACAIAGVLLCTCAAGQNYDYIEDLKAHPEMLYGCDYLCPAENTPLTAAPEGYEPFYINHYSRHGARFAWQDDLYDRVGEVLAAADSATNLTPRGREFYARFQKLYPAIRYSAGELSRKGWEQQAAIARLMYTRFPGVFDGAATVNAASSPAGRCIMSMSSFCLSLNDCQPSAEIYETIGRLSRDAVLPQHSDNPFRVKVEKDSLGFSESWEEYIERTVDYRAILSRIFLDTDLTLNPEEQWDFLYCLNFFAHGMPSLDTDLQFIDLFTFDEQVAMWKIDCFQFYCYGWQIRTGYRPIVDHLISAADERIASGKRGADLRFGHDTSFLPLLMVLGINGYDHLCTSGDEIPVWCEMNDVPMAANLQFVFYRNPGHEVLFKVLLNGSEARLPFASDIWPYYRWEEFKTWWCGGRAE